ncbi:MAG: hypothetical protein RJB39_557 [Candidatus Parcubacteria bacterium]|jgi:fructose-bisphosphate aldolase class I
MDHMNTETLHNTIKQIFAPGKGVLAADESVASIHKRFEALSIPQTEEKRLAYRRLLIGTPGLHESISGVIFHDETFRQEIEGEKTFAKYCEEQGIVPGIKVDKGLIDLPNFPGEKITLGLDGLKERLEEYYSLGARFCKWRAVVDVSVSTDSGIEANMRNLALYAGLAQQAGIVPMVEPEVLYEGVHSVYECKEKMQNVLTHLFGELALYKVDLSGVILKTSFVLPGHQNVDGATDEDETAKLTAEVLLATVPKNIGGVVFLSGGQSPSQASDNLSRVMKHGPFPFPITYSYSRAIQDPVLEHFAKNAVDEAGAREIFKDRLAMNTLALKGEYDVSKETGISSKVAKVTGSQDL